MARSLLLVLGGLAALLNAAALALALRNQQVEARPALWLGLALSLLTPLFFAAALTGRRRIPYRKRATAWFIGLQLLGAMVVGGLLGLGDLRMEALRPVLMAASAPPSSPQELELANRTQQVVPAPSATGILYGWQYPHPGGTQVVDSLDQVPPAMRGRASRIRILRPAGETAAAGSGARLPAEHQRLVDELNQHRLVAGLGLVAVDGPLSAGCQSHAEYLANNYGHPATGGLQAHTQDRRLPGFSEEGAAAAAQSTIAHSSDTSAVTMWMATLYHRAPLLDPRLERIGLGLAEVPRGRPTLPARLPRDFRLLTTVMNIAQRTRPSRQVVLYPAQGQREIPLQFGEGEVPNPIAGDPDGRAGYPISATFFAAQGGIPRIETVRSVLRDERGGEVPTYQNLPQRPLVPGHGEDTIGLIPRDPLRPRTTYQVEVEARVDGVPWRQSWSFTTGS